MVARDDYELELIKAQTAAALAQTALTTRQHETEFWKVGVAAVAAGAIFGGLVVGLL